MTRPNFSTALIVGAGPGIGASLARRFAAEGLRVGLAARHRETMQPLAGEIGGVAFTADAGQPAQVEKLFADMGREIGPPDVVVYNASGRLRGALVELDAAAVAESFRATALGGFLVGQAAARLMLPRRHGAILFTGASASIKGYAQSAPFAMGKFALRGLAQSMARELAPQGLHVAHFVIDGGVRGAARPEPADRPDSLLDPDAIAETYWSVMQQPRSAWSWEVELRPWVERF